MSDAGLMLHCGARAVTREQLALVPCPRPEGRWRPVPHHTVLEFATEALTDSGNEIGDLRKAAGRTTVPRNTMVGMRALPRPARQNRA